MNVGIPAPQSLALDRASLTQDMSSTMRNSAGNEDSQRCLIDFVEWWCYKTITSESSRCTKEYFEESVKACENLFSTDVEKPSFGRLCNRLLLASLSVDVSNLAMMNASEWMSLKEELILMKNKLLRNDADRDILLLSETERDAMIDAAPNLQHDQHPLFQAQYRHVLRLLLVQYHLSVFHSSLVQSRGQKRLVRQAIDHYEKHINHLFTQTSAMATTENDAASVMSVNSHDVRALPQELVGFLLKDLYHRGDHAGSSDDTALAARLLHHVESILKASPPPSRQPKDGVVDDGTTRFSHAATQAAVRDLLAQWQERILEEPTLVRLGYGDSSLTDDPASGHRKRLAHAEEDAMLRRLSSCGGQPTENVSDYASDAEEELERQAFLLQEDDYQEQEQDQQGDNHNDQGIQDESLLQPAYKKQRILTWDSCSEEEDHDDVTTSFEMQEPGEQ